MATCNFCLIVLYEGLGIGRAIVYIDIIMLCVYLRSNLFFLNKENGLKLAVYSQPNALGNFL